MLVYPRRWYPLPERKLIWIRSPVFPNGKELLKAVFPFTQDMVWDSSSNSNRVFLLQKKFLRIKENSDDHAVNTGCKCDRHGAVADLTLLCLSCKLRIHAVDISLPLSWKYCPPVKRRQE
ncbi:uncharacterized protein LOC111867460 [Cryptotermes secundus]|uniref:uncharacterized protein LOC111867460 n=1 Tax=Cryptotermes secundus TaxID=105785 RepID=UPI001454DF10|nr:uncharacterized protein LOC111867460 [Cryptotermes secundus]